MSRRSIILIKTEDRPASSDGAGPGGKPSSRQEMVPLGTGRNLIKALGARNISPDGSGAQGQGDSPGMAMLHGPGFIVELPMPGDGEDELSQAIVTLTDEDFAWPVLSRLCKELHWKMMDPDTGRTFG